MRRPSLLPLLWGTLRATAGGGQPLTPSDPTPAAPPPPTPSSPLEAGGFARAPPPLCPAAAGGEPPAIARSAIHWNVLYAEVPAMAGPGTGKGEGTDLSAIHGVSSQLAMCAYDGGSLGGGYTTPNFGLWPVCNAPPNCRNGAIPQKVNLTAHAEALQAAVEVLIPDENATGVAALDYEGWQPIWDDLLGEQYKNMSVELELAAEPSLPAAEASAKAEAAFNAAARAFYTTTFNTLKALRPKVRWSHHAYPDMTCYDTAAGRAHNDGMLWMFELLDVLSPSIYLQPLTSSPCADSEAALLRNTMAEATRMAERCVNRTGAGADGRPTPIIPFTWFRGEFPGNNSILDEARFRTEMGVPFEYGYTEAVRVWGSEAFAWTGDDSTDGGNCSTAAEPRPCDSGVNAMMQSFGAEVLDGIVRRQCDCAAQRCGGHGRCYANGTRCYCDAGFSGDDCATTAPSAAPSAARDDFDEPRKAALAAGDSVLCPDGISRCDAGQTCAQSVLGPWVCCPFPDATICGSRYCCPSGSSCAAGGHECVPK